MKIDELFINILLLWPLALTFVNLKKASLSKFVFPVINLYVKIMSPRLLLCTREGSSKARSLSSFGNVCWTSLVAPRWTFSTRSMSPLGNVRYGKYIEGTSRNSQTLGQGKLIVRIAGINIKYNAPITSIYSPSPSVHTYVVCRRRYMVGKWAKTYVFLTSDHDVH